MTKNQPLSEETKEAIRQEVKQARKTGEPTLKTIAAKYGIHPTMISKIAPNGAKAAVKAAPKAKRKTAKVAKPAKEQYTEADWEKAFENYISLRDQFAEADKLLKKIARELK